MARYVYDKSKVDNGLELLEQAKSKLKGISTNMKSGISMINSARGSEYISMDFSGILSLESTATQMINDLENVIRGKASEIQEYQDYKDAHPILSGIKTFGGTILSGGADLVQGAMNGIASIGDAGLAVVGWGAGVFGNDLLRECCEEELKEKKINNWFDKQRESGFLAGAEKYSVYSSNSTAASVIRGVGAAAPFVVAAIFTGGASAAGTISTNAALGIDAGLAGASALGDKTSSSLINGDDFDTAFTKGVVSGVGAAAFTFGVGKGAEKIGGALREGKQVVDKTDDAVTKVADKADDTFKSGTTVLDDGTKVYTSGESAAQNVDDVAKGAAQATNSGETLLIDKLDDAAAVAAYGDDAVKGTTTAAEDTFKTGTKALDDGVIKIDEGVDVLTGDVNAKALENADEVKQTLKSSMKNQAKSSKVRDAAQAVDDKISSIKNSVDDAIHGTSKAEETFASKTEGEVLSGTVEGKAIPQQSTKLSTDYDLEYDPRTLSEKFKSAAGDARATAAERMSSIREGLSNAASAVKDTGAKVAGTARSAGAAAVNGIKTAGTTVVNAAKVAPGATAATGVFAGGVAATHINPTPQNSDMSRFNAEEYLYDLGVATPSDVKANQIFDESDSSKEDKKSDEKKKDNKKSEDSNKSNDESKKGGSNNGADSGKEKESKKNSIVNKDKNKTANDANSENNTNTNNNDNTSNNTSNETIGGDEQSATETNTTTENTTNNETNKPDVTPDNSNTNNDTENSTNTSNTEVVANRVDDNTSNKQTYTGPTTVVGGNTNNEGNVSGMTYRREGIGNPEVVTKPLPPDTPSAIETPTETETAKKAVEEATKKTIKPIVIEDEPTTKKSGGSVAPIIGGVAAAGLAIGLGTKAVLDRKKNNENYEDENDEALDDSESYEEDSAVYDDSSSYNDPYEEDYSDEEGQAYDDSYDDIAYEDSDDMVSF